MLDDMARLHGNYSEAEPALVREVLSEAGQILRRQALRIRSETATSERRAAGA